MANNSRKDLDAFEASIKQYLDERASTDELFARKYSNEKKSVSECCQFIYTVVKKAGRVAWKDEEIFGMAVHYYDEENPGAIEKATPAQVMIPSEYYSPKELADVRDEMRRQVKEEIMREYERKAEEQRQRKASRRAEVEVEQPTLFG